MQWEQEEDGNFQKEGELDIYEKKNLILRGGVGRKKEREGDEREKKRESGGGWSKREREWARDKIIR